MIMRLLLAGIFLFQLAFAQAPGPVQLHGGEFSPPQGIKPTEELTVFDGYHYVLVQFRTMPDEAKRFTLKSLGVELLEYIPSQTYTAKVPAGTDMALLEPLGVSSVFQLQPGQKLHINLTERGIYPDWAYLNASDIRVNLVMFDPADRAAAREAIEKAGFSFWEGNRNPRVHTVTVPERKLSEVAAWPFVRFIEPADPEPVPDNYTGRTGARSNVIASDHGAGRQYNGKGIVIGHQDDGDIENDHPDWKGRVVHDATPSSGDHGDHIAGTLIGAGNRDPKGRGLAFGAVNYYRSVYDLVNNMATHYNRDSVLITSTSYSNGCNAGYTAFAQQHDQQTLDFPGLLHVFSGGNAGGSNCGYGAGAGWGNVTGGHKHGKNVIAVANTTELDDIAPSSSRGPAHDGRIKPDIAAKGTNVYSTTDLNASGYTTKTGTSMACPHVAASLAQLYQAYREINNVTYPPSDLMKNVILNTADDLGNEGPDFIYGWGRINNLKAVRILENRQYLQDSLTGFGINNHAITIPSGVAQVKVMLYWHDAPATVGATTALVNDLDLKMITPSNDTVLPYVLYTDSARLDLPAHRGEDHLNNMEQVVIDNPAPGTYTANAASFIIPFGTQSYWITYEFIYDDITVTYPYGGERLVPGEQEFIRWDAFGSTGTFTIEFSADSGASWSTVSTSVSSGDRSFQWTVPNTITDQALIRVSRGGNTAQSTFNFDIMEVPVNLDMVPLCQGKSVMNWDSIPGARAYIVSELGAMYMQPVDTVTTNSYVFSGLTPGQANWYSVEAIHTGGAQGRRAIAIQHANSSNDPCFPVDAEITGLISPQSGCGLGSGEVVRFQIQNVGDSIIRTGTSVSIEYQVNNDPPVLESFIPLSDILPGGFATIDFLAPANLSGLTTHKLDVWITLPGDNNPANDTLKSQVENVTPVSTYPYVEDFENWNICGNSNSDCGADCSGSVRNGWTQSKTDDQDWRVNAGSTPSGNTGPDRDHTPGTSNGRYIYTESSGGCNNQVFELESPCFDLRSLTVPTLGFHYHMYGSQTGSIEVYITNDFGASWNLLWAQNGQVQTSSTASWEPVQDDLSAYTNDVVSFRIVGTTGGDHRSDMAIDAFAVYEDTCVNPIVLGTTEGFDQITSAGLPSCWTTNSPAAVFTTTGCSGSTQRSLQLDGSTGAFALSPFMDGSAHSGWKVKYDYRAGDDNACGENPEPGDIVRIDYLDGTNWVTARSYDGASAPQVFTADSFFISTAVNTATQLRFFVVNGSGVNFDNFNFDNLVITPVCLPQGNTDLVDICQGDSYTLPGGGTVNSTGSYVDTLGARFGCDSLVTTLLTVRPTFTVNDAATICDGDTLDFGNQRLTSSGNYFEVYTTRYGCDSTLNMALTVVTETTTQVNDTICDGDTYAFGNQNLFLAGNYRDTLLSADGCDSIAVLDLVVNQVNINVIQTGVTLTATAQADAYQWIDCATRQAIPGATSASFTATANGRYAVAITQHGSCTDTSVCVDITSVRLDQELMQQLKVYPNPSDGRFTVEYLGNQLRIERMVVLDPLGREVWRTEKPGRKTLIDLREAARGHYVLKVNSPEGQAVIELVKY